jgi:spore germination cell wall hydrolase CwlJ-like protein
LNSWALIAASLGIFLICSQPATQLDHLPATAHPLHSQRMTSLDYRELRCVATAVYHESAHEPQLGQIAVARVIQNRVRKQFAATACDVVYQRRGSVCQFSWACNAHRTITAKECANCWSIAVQVFAHNQHQSVMPRALYFHATYINPQWTGAHAIKTIGHHKFYR